MHHTIHKRRRLAAATLALASMLAAVAAPAGAADASLANARRIVAIGGSITEIVYALGEEGRLVARDSTSTFPQAANALPDVGYMRALSPEGVLSVDPDGILALEGSGPPEAVAVLKSGSIAFAEIPEHFTRAGIVDKVVKVGEALGVSEKAQALATAIGDKLAAAEAKAAKSEPRKVMFVLSMQGGKILAAGRDTAAGGIVSLAGGVNVFSGFSGYKQVSDEAVITAAPDVILMMDRGGDHGAANAELLAHPAIATTPAAAHGAVVRMDGLYLLGFGPRTAEAVADLAGALHPDQQTSADQ